MLVLKRVMYKQEMQKFFVLRFVVRIFCNDNKDNCTKIFSIITSIIF